MRFRASAIAAAFAVAASPFACQAIAGLEPPTAAPAADAPSAEANILEATIPDAPTDGVVDAGPRTWCTGDREATDEAIATDASRRGPQLFCVDFESAAKLDPDTDSFLVFSNDTAHAASPPDSLKIFVRKNPDENPRGLRSHLESMPADRLEFAFDFSFGLDPNYPASATTKAVTVAAIRFGSDQAVSMGVVESQFAVAFVEDLLTISATEIAKRAQRLTALNPERAFQRVIVRIVRGKPKECDVAAQAYVGADGGTPGDLFVVTYDALTPLPRGCAQLPAIADLGSTTTFAVGGILEKPANDFEWRFDNITVHAAR